MAGAAGVVAHAWTEWGIQALVLFSFTLQVTLLVLAEFRRRVDSGMLRFFVWSAYVLADATAIFVLGHLSATSRSREHELMALWAPLLLVHLGGQDNITAYAIEDNRLWLRHLQTLAVQVGAVAYVLYQSNIFGNSLSSSLLGLTTVVMFVVGILKYGERVWALWRASSSPIGRNYRGSSLRGREVCWLYEMVATVERDWDAQDVLCLAHLTLDVPQDYLKGPLPYDFEYEVNFSLGVEVAYKVAEMHISLMHGMYYTKAEVMRNWYGQCIRLISLLATPVALILFHVHVLGHGRKVGYIRADVAVTYVLLAGAVVLETTAASRAIFSSETWAHLSCRGPFSKKFPALVRFVRHVVVSLRQFVHTAGCRQWSGSMGQHNVLQLCARSRTSPWSRMAFRIGVEDWWNTLAYSWSVPVSTRIRTLLVTQVMKSWALPEASPDHILNSRGRAALKSFKLCHDLDWSVDPELSLEVSILIWHIATNLYLSWYKDQPKGAGGQEEQEDDRDTRTDEAAKVLSNYMVFLLAARPYMLPAPASRSPYLEMCYGLTYPLKDPPGDLTSLLRRYGNALNTGSQFRFNCVPLPPYKEGSLSREENKERRDALEKNETLMQGCMLGTELINKVEKAPQSSHAAADMLELIAQVWVEILCYVGHKCSSYSHAKQISNGGELITVAAILMEYLKRGILRANSNTRIDL